MHIGKKIKQLRTKAGYTQEQLAHRLNISPQSVSKWENASSMPDITLLPKIAELFGVSIDELFDLTREEKLNRIENRMDIEEELSPDVFSEFETYLHQKTAADTDLRSLSLLAHLYHHRMEADGKKVSQIARRVTLAAPDNKDCQWLLQKSEGATSWDWNVANHSSVIDFYFQLVKDHPSSCISWYYLIDNLLADRRTEEAAQCLKKISALPTHKPFVIDVYKAHIALQEGHSDQAEAIIRDAADRYAENSGFLYEAAQFYAKSCQYDKALGYYEASYAHEANLKPRYIDALDAIATIHQINGNYAMAAATCDRILDNLKNEWGFTEETSLGKVMERKQRLLERI